MVPWSDTFSTPALGTQNLNERKLVRGKMRREERNFLSFLIFFFLLFFGSGTQGTKLEANVEFFYREIVK